MKRYIVLLFILLPLCLFAQSVYIHEAQEEGGSLNSLDTIMTILSVILLGFFLLFLLPLVVRDKIKDAKTSKEVEGQIKIDKEKKVIEKQQTEERLRANAIPKAIDLGLSVKWSAFNYNAYESTDVGKYYRWGDLEEYGKEPYQLKGKDFNEIGNISGNPNYDIVSKTWGDGWRMPTKDEMLELIEKCICRIEIINGVEGLTIEGTNGNSIFLPSTGYYFVSWELSSQELGCYWSSTPKEKFKDSAYNLSFGGKSKYPIIGSSSGRIGKVIRPVKG